jgi:glycosyltransferase involved in cell wall biosynthesis
VEILYVFPEPLPLPRARGIQVAHTVAALCAQGLGVHLVHARADGGPEPFASYGLPEPEGLRRSVLSRGLPGPLKDLPVRSNKLFHGRLRPLLASMPPGLVMVRHLKSALWLLRHAPGIPLLYEAHEVFAETARTGRGGQVGAMEAFVLDHAAGVVAQSQATARGLAERYRTRRTIHVVPNGVAVPETLPAKPWAEAGQRVLYSGNLFGWKGADVLVEAARWLPGLSIKILGGDPQDVETLRHRIPATGARVKLAGRVPPAAVAEQLARGCIAVLPNRDVPESRWTSPLKLFEYMAAGCAIVASDLPAIREVLAEDEAQWVRPGDAEALAAGIRELVKDPARAEGMGARVWQRARAYTWEARSRRLVAIMREVAND